MRTALVQMISSLEPDANLQTIGELTADVTADLIVLPEAVMADFGPPDTPLGPLAQPLDGPFVAGLAAIARRRAATVVAGMFERSDDPDRPYNTLVVVGPDGGLVATYRKAHLYDSFGYRESDRLSPGETTPVAFSLPDLRVGLLTCYDLRFPEQARALVDAGADALVVPAAWLRGPLKEDHWETLLRARAIENTVYVAAADQCGTAYCGRSMAVDPLGVTVASAGNDVTVVHTTINATTVASARDRNPALSHRRTWPTALAPH